MQQEMIERARDVCKPLRFRQHNDAAWDEFTKAVAQALLAAKQEGLEMAAEACINRAANYDTMNCYQENALAGEAQDCAEAIRAMKEGL